MGKFLEYANKSNYSNKKKKDEEKTSSATTQIGNFGKYAIGKTIGLDTLQSDLTSLSKTIDSVYNGWQTRETMDNTLSSVQSMYDRLGKYQEYQKKYGGTDLSELQTSYKSILDGWDDLSKHYGRYKDADAYNNALKVAEEQAKEYEGMKTADLGAMQTEISDLEGILKTVKEHESTINGLKVKKNTWEYRSNGLNTDNSYGDKLKAAENEYNEFLKSIGYESAEALKKALGEKKVYLNKAQRVQDGISLSSVADKKSDNYDKDFGKYVEKGKALGEERNSLWDGLNGKGDYKNQIAHLRNSPEFLEIYEDISDENGAIIRSVNLNDLTYLAAKYMTEDEFNLHSYYMGKEDYEGAENYLKSIEETLKQRQGTAIYEERESMLDKYTFAYTAGIDQFTQGTINRFNTEDDYIPVSGIQNASGLIREDIAYEHGSLGQAGYDLINTASNMAPSILASTVVSAVATPLAGEVVGNTLMGVSASGNAYQEMLNLGYDKKQANSYANLVGASEVALQSLLGGISKLGGAVTGKTLKALDSIDNAFFRFAAKYEVSKLGEGFEEGLQSFLEPIFMNIAAGYDTGADVDWGEVVYSGLLGYVMGGVFEGPNLAMNAYGEKSMGKTIKANERVGEVFDIASNPEVASAYETYTRYANKGINADNITDAQLGRLYTEARTDSQSTLDSKKSTQEQRDSAQKIKNNLDVYGKYNPSARINKKIAKDAKDEESIKALIESGLESGENTESFKLATEYQAKLDSGKKLSTNEILRLVEANEKAFKDEDSKSVTERLVEEGESAELADIVTRKLRGETITTEEAEKVLDSDVAWMVIAENSNAENVTDELIAKAKTMDKEKGALFISLYDGETDIDEYANAFNLVTTKAENNFTFDNILQHKNVLSGEQISKIYSEVRIKADHKQTMEFQKLVEKTANLKAYKAVIDESAIDYDNTSAEGKVNWDDLTSRQKKAVTFIKGFAQATGMNLTFVANNPKYNGKYDRTSNTIYINLDKDGFDAITHVRESLIPTMSHEITHWMEKKSPALYRRMNEIVFSTLQRFDGLSEDERIAKEITNAVAKEYKAEYEKENPGKKISLEKALKMVSKDVLDKALTDSKRIDRARSEIIARACENMLSMSEQGKKMFNSLSESEQKTFVDKIKELIQNLKDWVSELLGLYKSGSYEAKIMKAYEEDLNELLKVWDEMLEDSVKVNQALEKNGAYGENASADNTILAQAKEIDTQGNSYWQIETEKDIFKGIDTVKGLQKAAFNYILNGDKGNKITALIDGKRLDFIRVSAEEYVYGKASQDLSTEEYKQKMRMSTSIIDLIENATIEYDAPDHKKHKLFPNGFKNYQGRVGIDETIFRYIVRVGKAKNGMIFYDINLEVDGRVPRAKSTSPIKSSTSKDSILNSDKNVKENISDMASGYAKAQEMQIEINQLTDKIRGLEKGDDFKAVMDVLTKSIKSNDTEKGIAEYEKWLAESGYSEARERRDTLQNELKKLRAELQAVSEQKALDEEQKALEKSGLSEADYFRKQAVKEFGYTPYFYDAGYITPNGKMLNFSGEKGQHYGSRGQDHRAIGIVYANVEGSKAMIKFMGEGNVRIMAESPGIDISSSVEPSTEQYATIRKFVREYANKEYFNVDLTDADGHTVGNYEYEGRISAERVVNDIKYFFENGTTREQSSVSRFLYSEKSSDIQTEINASMTMDEAKQMIQRAFVIGGIYEWYEGEYKNGDEWLRGVGASEVALNIENEYTLTEKYLNKLQGYIDGDFYVEDILEAYLKGTLVGKEKPKTKRLDLSQEYRINDNRFYSPQQIKNAKKLLSVAMQRVTNENRKEVSKARAKILLFAHNKGASELLGLSQAELNKKLRAWSNYSAKARDVSKRFNNGVADSNKWTGIENCSWLYKSTIETKDLEKLVKSIKGAASDYEKMYIARTMLALDTHIDWSWLSFEFDTYNRVNEGKTFSVSKCLGYYTNEGRKIVVTHDKPNTVAHEMGHALDYQWARDLGYNYGALTEITIRTEAITDSATRRFFENFKIFIDSLTDNGDIRTEYTQNPKEVFARFVARFVEWVDNTGTGRNSYNTESFYYNDKFTASHYIEFVKLLQEKAMLDAKRMEAESKDNVLFSDKEGNIKKAEELTETDFRDLLERVQYGVLADSSYIPMRASTPEFFIDVVHEHSKGEFNMMHVPMAAQVEHLRQNMEEEEEGISYGEARPHNLSVDDIVTISKEMGHPAYIVLQKNGRYAMVVSFYNKARKKVVVSIDFASDKDTIKNYKYKQYMNGYNDGYYNIIVTQFEPDDLSSYLKNNEVVYDKKKMNGRYQVGFGRIVTFTHDTPFIEDIVSHPEKDVKDLHSDKDSEGNTLTKAQQEFFKDSKVRDAEGNLRVMWHGTHANFTVFDIGKAGSNWGGDSRLGKGFYFASTKEEAQEWGKSSKTIKAYLNLTNPLDYTKPIPKNIAEEIDKYVDEKLASYDDKTFFISKEQYAENLQRIKEMYNKDASLFVDLFKYDNKGKMTDGIREFLSGLGYDGIISKDEVVAFYPEQIKLTTNKKPTNDVDIRYSEKETTNVYDLMGETERLKKENERFKAEIERLKERLKIERKITHGNYFNENQLGAVAGHLRNIAKSSYDKVTLMRELKDVYSFIAQSPNLTWEEVFEKCYRVAYAMLEESKPITMADEYTKSILSDIRNTKISLSETQKQEAKYIFGKHWNRNFFGRATIVNKGIPLESQWQEWAELYPHLFDTDVSEGNMPEKLYDILNDLQDAAEIEMEYDEEEQIRWLAREIYNQYWNVSPIRTTAEKYDKQIKLLNFEHRKAMAEFRADYEDRVDRQRLVDDMYYRRKMSEQKGKFNSKLAEQRKAEQERRQKLYKELRERKDTEIALAKKHGREMVDKYKDNAERKTILQSTMSTVMSLNKKLTTNSKDVHIPEALKPVVINLINAIDFSSKQLLGMSGTKKDFRGMPTKSDIANENALSKVHSMTSDAPSLKIAIQDALELFENAEKVLSESSDGTVDSSVVALDVGMIDDIKKMIRDLDILAKNDQTIFVLQEMSTDHLKTLNAMVKSINHWAIVADQALANKHKQRISELSWQTIEENDILGERQEYIRAIEDFKNFFNWSNLLPVNAFKRLGNAATVFFDSLRDSQDTVTFNRQEIMDFTDKLLKEHKDIKKWRKDVKEFTLKLPNGKVKTVRMPVSYIMSLYCVAKQEDAKRHMYGQDKSGGKLTYTDSKGKTHDGGGITISGFKEEGFSLKVSKDKNNTIISEEIVKQITGVLTNEQREVADALQKYMNDKGSEWGNAVSMVLYGIKKFSVKDYFPMKVSPNTLTTNNTDDKRSTSMFSIINYGFTKERNPNASQSLEIGDIFDVFANHMNMVAIYNAYALSVYDIARWYNYKGKTETGDEISVTTSIENAFGSGASTYVRNLIKDLNGQHESSRLGFISKLFKNAKSAMVGFSPSVTLLQPTAYFKAMTKISPQYLLKSALYVKDFGARNGVAKAKEHCGIALLKSQGYFETGVSANTTTKLLHDESFKEKAITLSLKGAEFFDETTWGVLWNACEFEVRAKRKDLKVGSKEFYEVVGNKLSDVIYETQVVDSPLTKSDLMRSPDTGAKMVTMFASEMTVAYNIVLESLYDVSLDVKRNGKEGAAKRNGKRILTALTAYTLTSVANALVQTAIQEFLNSDDDDEETTFEKFFANFLADWLIVGKIPYIKETISFYQGYSASRPDLEAVESAFQAYRYWEKIVKGKEKEDTLEKAIYKTLQALSYGYGVGVHNIEKNLVSILKKLGIID